MVILKEKINKAIYFLYELALLLALCVFFITPIHKAATRHYNIDQVVNPSSVGFTAQDTSFIVPGDLFPVYRMNPDWTSEIGWIRVTSIKGHDILASFDPNHFRWPMGRQGRVVGIHGPMVKVKMGSDLGFKTGDNLCLFKDRTLVGKVQLQDIYPDHSLARVLNLSPGINPEGLTASEFIFVTQVAFFKNPFIRIIEVWMFIFILVAHCYYFIVCKEPLLLSLGNWLRHQYQNIPKRIFYWAINIILGIPFIWYMINFPPRCFDFLWDKITGSIGPVFHISSNALHIYPLVHNCLPGLYLASAAIYLMVLIWKDRSPILMFWQWAGFKAKKSMILKGVLRDIVIWTLHLIIFYAFGNVLLLYLRNNLNELNVLLGAGRALSSDEVFLVIRYLLWSVTIVGCLFGYLYSVFGYLFAKRIRNLDFTIMGWVTNAVCYSYLLGIPITQMTASLTGLDPIATQGPLFYFRSAAELILNLLYTISIWNLGTLFGVMTDKGVRTSGFYSVVRHPSYTLEALMFAMIYLNGVTTYQQWCVIFNMFILSYYVRSEREDQFMAASNPQYKLYQQNTPYKFIPGVY